MVVLQMFASVCAGQATPKMAASEAQRRAERYFRKARTRSNHPNP